MLRARPGEAWLIRPDAHIAAVLPDPAPDSVAAAACRALALPAAGAGTGPPDDGSRRPGGG
jgi:pentachlorophenol monooxygenase/3-(3-hydroxy-phenyl)propionate hydroxylase